MRAPLHPAWVWLPPAIALAALAAIVASGSNHALFLLLNRAGGLLGEPVWLRLTMFGDGAIAMVLVLPSIRRAPHCFWAALAAAVFAGLWTQVTKQFIDVPRPLAVFGAGEFFHAGPAYRQVSFPSGHAAAAFAIAGIGIMGLARHMLVRALLLAMAVLVSLSRIMVGVHWPVDILWGMIGGWVGAWAGLALHGRCGWRTSGIGGLLAGLLLLGMAGGLLVSHHMHIPAVMPLQRTVAGACLLWGTWEIAAMLPWRRWRWRWRWRWPLMPRGREDPGERGERGEQAGEWAGGRATAQASDRLSEHTNERAAEPAAEWPIERIDEHAGKRSADVARPVAINRSASDG
jgi:membrane-associated phospholipid phosphatase